MSVSGDPNFLLQYLHDIKGQPKAFLSQLFVAIADATITFTGSGLDDMTASGVYTGDEDAFIEVKVLSAAASPDTFEWRKDGGAWSAGVNMDAGTPVVLAEGISVTFAAQETHTDDEFWAFYVMSA